MLPIGGVPFFIMPTAVNADREIGFPKTLQEGANTNLSDDEKEDLRIVKDFIRIGKSAKAEAQKDWGLFMDFYNDEQWEQKRPSYVSSIVFNISKSVVNTRIPILTDAKPGFNVLPSEPSDFQFSEILNKVTEGWWEKYTMDQKMVEALMDSNILGTGIFKVIWNPTLEEGIGDVDANIINPRDILVPPQATDFQENCPWVVHLMRKEVGELRRQFPEFADQIKADTKGDDRENQQRLSSRRDILVVSPINKDDPAGEQLGPLKRDERETALVAEVWLDDFSLEDYIAGKDENGKAIKQVKKKYPNGKLITALVNQNIILQSVENPYKDGKKPFVRIPNVILPRSFWAEGEIKPLVDLQKAINKNLSNILDYEQFMSNPVWIIDKESGVDPRRITNQYGLIISKNANTEVRREIPNPIPSSMFQLHEILKQAVDIISGVNDVTQGRRPAGITAAEAISELQEAAQTRIRLAERNLQGSLQQMGKLIISRIMQFYKEPRVVKLVGENGFPEFFEFMVKDVEGEDGKVQGVARSFEFDEEAKEFRQGQVQETQPTKGIFDIRILSGTSLPFERNKRGNQALQLFDRQIIDEEEVLEKLQWPNKEEVLKRIQERKAAAEEAALQEGAPPPQGG